MKLVSVIRLSFFFVCGGALACSTEATSPCGEGGAYDEGPTLAYCSYIVIVGGFECPAAFEHRIDLEGGTICTSEPIEVDDVPLEVCGHFSSGCTPTSEDPDSGVPDADAPDGGEGVLCPTERPTGACSGPYDQPDAPQLALGDKVVDCFYEFGLCPPANEPFYEGCTCVDNTWQCEQLEFCDVPDTTVCETKGDDVSLKLELPSDGSYTQAQLAAGVAFGVQLSVKSPLSGVLPVPQDGGQCGNDRIGGLIYFVDVTGGDQQYCLCDVGNCGGFGIEPVDVAVGDYSVVFSWDGHNWDGPSDFDNPKGEPFPPGIYSVRASIIYKPDPESDVTTEVVVECPVSVTE